MSVNSGELLFVKSVKDGIPNRDPLQNSDARRIFGEDDGRISLTDVSLKRDVRDYILDAFPNGGDDQEKFIFVQEKRDEKDKLFGRGRLAKYILEEVGADKKENIKEVLLKHCFDARTFGIVFSESGQNFHMTGPVQFGWSHSLHDVESKYVQGTVVLPSKDGEDASKSQGTIWTIYTVPFAVFAMTGVINASAAKQTGMSEADQELLLEGLWKGTLNRQARGRGQQQPLFLCHIEYNDPFFRIGYLDELVRLTGDPQDAPKSVRDMELDVSLLVHELKKYEQKIKKVRIWRHDTLTVTQDLSQYEQPVW